MNFKFKQVIFLVSLIWYSLTAYYSVGYYHADEHYQIIEFAEKFEGTNQDSDLAWEYNAHIRPSVQPMLCYAIFEVCKLFCIQDPYTKAFVLRLLTGFFALFSIYLFTNSSQYLIDQRFHKAFLLSSFFLWFLPFINVRFSSETWSGLLLLIAVAVTLKENLKKRHFFLIGFLSGMSFLFRFQTIIASAGLLFWLIIIKNENLKNISLLLFGGIIALLFGVLSDYIFYESLVFTPWKYLKINLIDGVANSYGTSPWYYYFYFIFRFSFFPFGILILGSLIYLIHKNPKSLFVWLIVPFFLVHSFISHKELRFLFPLVNLTPIIFFLSLQAFVKNHISGLQYRTVYLLGFILIFVNFAGLITASLKPAHIGRIFITRKFHQIKSEKNISLISCCGSNPFDPWNGLVANYYLDSNMSMLNLSEVNELDSSLFLENKFNLLVLNNLQVQDSEVREIISQSGLKEIAQSIPPFFVPFLELYGGFSTTGILILYSDEGN